MPDAQTLYAQLNALVHLEDLLLRGSQRFHSPGYEDLFAEVLTRRGSTRQISLARFIVVGAVAFDRQGQQVVNQSVLAELSEFLASLISRLTAENYTLRNESSNAGRTFLLEQDSREKGGRP